MLKPVDKLLDKVTMYRLTLYVLIGLEGAAFILSLVGVLHYSPRSIIISSLTLIISCYIINKILAFIFRVPTNIESSLITALILALILPPYGSGSIENFTFLLMAAGLAMASKYVLSYKGSHIFNPAAIAVALTALGPRQSADWWVGTTVMLPFVLVGGVLLTRKTRRGRMVMIFLVTALAASVLYSILGRTSVPTDFHQTLTTSSMFFLGFIMLTEPLTSPKTESHRDIYALLVGVLFPPQFHILSLYSTPELALIAGNIFSFIVSPKSKFFASLKQRIRITPDSVDFVFDTPSKLEFSPGQYMEWTIPHKKTDRRGNRRYFTIASSPTEDDLRIGVKFYEQGSSYKNAMLKLTKNSSVMVDQLAGDFTLPKDKTLKLVFIAGGIGITPFRSMIKYLIDKHEKRDIVLLYSIRTKKDIAYSRIFEAARKDLGIRIVYFVTGEDGANTDKYVRYGRVNEAIIKELVPDYKSCTFYVSGTQGMVQGVSDLLNDIGVYSHQIKTDYFSGYTK